MKNKRWLLLKNISLIVFTGLFVVALVNYLPNFVNENFNLGFVLVTKISTKETLWLVVKIIVFFFAFVAFCHGPLVWIGILFSIEDGKGRLVYAKDRIIALKITYWERCLNKDGNVVKDTKNMLIRPFKWFRNYFFGSLHILGIPGIHGLDVEKYDWESLNPVTGEVEKRKSFYGEFPLREFVPSISFKNLDVTGGQINVKIGPLIKIATPIKTATVARDWFALFTDMMRGHIKECFGPMDFFRVMLNKKNFGTTNKKVEDLSVEVLKYFRTTNITTIDGKDVPLIDHIKDKYGIEIIQFYAMDPDPTEDSKKVLDLVSKPITAKIEGESNIIAANANAKTIVITAEAEADAFNKKREAMEKPGGRFLKQMDTIRESRLLTLGSGKNLNILVNPDEQSKGGGTGGNP